MEGMYDHHRAVDFSAETMTADDLHGLLLSADAGGAYHDRIPSAFAAGNLLDAPATSADGDDVKSRIAAHPLYPRLLEAYIDCQKVGAPPEIASLLDEIRRENDEAQRYSAVTNLVGADPELDEFMETYCDVLVKYRTDLARPFDEANSFLNSIEMQLSDLCNGPSRSFPFVSDEIAGSSKEELSGGEREAHSKVDGGGDLKDKLRRKYSGYLSSLTQEFSKKKKKGKLPKDARRALLDWWNAHYKWPYPTEGDKIALAESTGLDQKQINNWFINQRKRHWKPTESMQFDGFSFPFYADD